MFLEQQGAWFVKYWGGGRYTKRGIPDIIVCLKGHFVAVETKAPDGKATELQLHTLKKIDKAGGFAFLLYPDQYEMFVQFAQFVQADCQRAYKEIYNEMKGRWC